MRMLAIFVTTLIVLSGSVAIAQQGAPVPKEKASSQSEMEKMKAEPHRLTIKPGDVYVVECPAPSHECRCKAMFRCCNADEKCGCKGGEMPECIR